MKIKQAIYTFIFIAISSVLIATQQPTYDKHVSAEYSAEFVSNREARQYLSPVLLLHVMIEGGIGTVDLGSATGFSVSASRTEGKSYILTNEHFCAAARTASQIPMSSMHISYKKGDSQLFRSDGRAKIIYGDPAADLCILEADEYIKPVTFDKSYRGEFITPVRIVGGPQGSFPIVYDTYISSTAARTALPFINMHHGGREYLFLSGVIMPGHSGSPIFNENGRVVGIVFAAPPTMYGGFGIQVADIMDWLDEQSITYKSI